MNSEIDNKRQDVGNANSLHPYAGDSPPTQHIMRQLKYSEFFTLFQVGNQRVFRFVVLYFQRCRKDKSCTAFLLFISAVIGRGHKTMPLCRTVRDVLINNYL